MRTLLVAVLAIVGCGRLAFDPRADDAAAADATAPACVAGPMSSMFTTLPSWLVPSLQGGASLEIENQTLVATLASGGDNAAYADGLFMARADRRIAVTVIEVPNTPAGVYMQIGMHFTPSTRMFHLTLSGNSVYFSHADATMEYASDSRPYNAVADRRWAIRLEAGMIYGETSLDGASWSVVTSFQAPADTQIAFDIGASVIGTVAAPGRGRWDDLQDCLL